MNLENEEEVKDEDINPGDDNAQDESPLEEPPAPEQKEPEKEFSISDELAREEGFEPDDGESDIDEPDDEGEPALTRSMKKRLKKLNADHSRQLADLKAELEQTRRDIYSRTPAQTQDFNAYQQYQQQQQSQQPNYGYQDPNAMPQGMTFDQYKQWQQRMQAEEKQRRDHGEVESVMRTLDRKISSARHSDHSFAQLCDQNQGHFTAEMLYGLSTTKNPAAFIKHILKNPKDRAMLKQLQNKNPYDQIATISKWATMYEANIRNNQPAVSANKSTPIKPIGAGEGKKDDSMRRMLKESTTWSADEIDSYIQANR